MDFLKKEAREILKYCRKILTDKEKHSFSKFFGKNFSERSIETPWVASAIKKFKIKSLLDIGFSLSSLDYLGLLLELKKNFDVNIKAVDIIKPERVKNRYPKEWLDDIFSFDIAIGDLRNIQVIKGKFNAVTCISTIEHIGFDKATKNNSDTVFERKKKPEDVNMSRNPETNNIVLTKIHTFLKSNGILLISVPMGKGGPILFRDSLGYYLAVWEYDEDSWNDIIQHNKFKLTEQHFFKFNTEEYWQEIESIQELSNQNSTLKKHAQGCGIALLKKK